MQSPASSAPFMNKNRGRLFCIPTPIGESRSALQVLPPDTLERVRELSIFVAESAKIARRFLRQVDADRDLPATRILELNEHTAANELETLLQPLLQGHDLGLISDAGCPGIADPGAELVAQAQKHGIRVIPLIGPCSIVLSLMASGLNGQRFGFVGYVPAERDHRERELRSLERRSATNSESIVMIETPYRARALLESMLAVLSPQTRLCIAHEIGEPGESILSQPISLWRKKSPEFPKGRAVFVLQAEFQRNQGASKPVPKDRYKV